MAEPSPDKVPAAASLFDRVGGSEGVHAFVWRFYELVADDADLRPLYPEDMGPGREKLALFLQQWLGGPGLYSEMYGHPRLRMRHFPFAVTEHGAGRWLRHMRQAMQAAGVGDDDQRQIFEALAPLARHMVNQASWPGPDHPARAPSTSPVESEPMDEPALSGVRVLEIGGGIPAAFACRLLAGYGADVVRHEANAPTLTRDEEVYLLPGKRRVGADGVTLRSLALASDIIVEDGPPGALAALGLDPVALRREKPGLVIVSVSPFGQTGPHAGYAATNIVSFAMGGLLSLTGSPNRQPLQNGGSQAQYLGGINAFGAAVTTYYGALVHGEGDWVDISLQECAAGMLELYGPGAAYTGLGPQMRMGNHVRAVWAIYPCIDGYAGVCALERQVPALFDLVGIHEERFRDPAQRVENDDELTAIMYGWFAERTKEEILACSPIHKVPFGAVLTPADLLASKNLQTRGFFDAVATRDGEARIPGRPFEGLPWHGGALSAPGSDTESVTRDWLGVRV